MIKKSDIQFGMKVKVVKTGKHGVTPDFYFNAHRAMFDEDELLPAGEELEVTLLPHTNQRINLVGVRRVRDGKEGKVYYTDFVRRCEPV